MTRHFLLFFAVALLGGYGLQGQSCVPDTTIPDSVAVSPQPYTEEFPERGIQDTACANSYFETVLHINLPESLATPLGQAPINGASIATEDAVIDGPPSFDYVCNPPNCEFTPDTVGCIVLYGTATEAEIGQYDLKIEVAIDIGLPTPFVTTLPNASIAPGNYYLFVQPEGSPNCFTVDTDEPLEGGFDMIVQPNPISDFAEIFVRLPQSGTYTFSVYNAMGAQVRQDKMQLVAGEQYLPFDASALPVGMYVFTLQGTEQAASGRILVQR